MRTSHKGEHPGTERLNDFLKAKMLSGRVEREKHYKAWHRVFALNHHATLPLTLEERYLSSLIRVAHS